MSKEYKSLISVPVNNIPIELYYKNEAEIILKNIYKHKNDV